jgi:hypothetical protein
MGHSYTPPTQRSGCTTNPTGGWVTQQARNLSFTGLLERMRFLIHGRDGKFSAALSFGTAFSLPRSVDGCLLCLFCSVSRAGDSCEAL